MKIRPWGARGSIPSPGPSTFRYGGNTSCVEVRLSDDTLIILDAGSGVRALGAALGSCQAVLLLSHYQLDHLQGMPFFGPAYSPHSSITVLGPEFNGGGPDRVLGAQMMNPYFPAPASDWLGVCGYGVIEEGRPFAIGSASVTAARLSHPGLTFGYRIEEEGHVLAYLSDNEPGAASPELLRGFIEIAGGADVLIHDCQYTESEYEARHNWGHSTPRQAIEVAGQAGARRLMMFHHDPTHSDEQVEALAEEAATLAEGVEVVIGREGEVTVVTDDAFSILSPELPGSGTHEAAKNGQNGRNGSVEVDGRELKVDP